MKSPAWDGDHPLSAGEYYSSGTYHGSWDVAMPNYTNIRAPVDGEILDYVTGVPNVPGGSGSPSNWILLGFNLDGKKVCYYFQHLSKAQVNKGQKVKAGDKIGESGNSGNSSGPHLHLTLQDGWKTAATRYDYLNNNSAIYAPDKGWKDMALSQDDINKIAKAVWQIEVDVATGDQKPNVMSVKNALKQARNQAEDAAGKPSPSVSDIWDYPIEIADSQPANSNKASWFLRSIQKSTRP